MIRPENSWQRVLVDGHEVWLFEPEVRHARGYSVIYLHDQRDEIHLERSHLIDACRTSGLRVVAPRAERSWWLDRLVPCFDQRYSPLEFIAQEILPLTASRLEGAPAQTALLGVGMGGQGALRLAYKLPRLFPVVAAIRPAIDFHLLVPDDDEELTELFGDREWARQHTATLHVHPLNWPTQQFFCCDPQDYAWFDSSDRLRMKLGSMGIPFEADLETSAGGVAPDYVAMQAERAVAFVIRGLEKERLRVE